MQVTGQNVQPNSQSQVRYNSSYNCGNSACPNGNTVTNPQIARQTAAQTVSSAPVQPQYSYPQNYYIPQSMTPIQAQPQNLQIPASSSGVNIQIFNPTVSAPGTQPPAYNVNAPCYPSNYYTGQLTQNNQPNLNNGGQNGNINNNGATPNNTNTTGETDEKKKTEKKKIVQLTDDYIKNLESYLNSQEKEIRLSAAKEVYARLEEDEYRKDDKALNALINKMLQDPVQEIRVLALTALEGRLATGDNYTADILTKMQSDNSNYGMDAIDASKILLQMSGKQVEKEVPVTEKKTEKKSEKEPKKA